MQALRLTIKPGGAAERAGLQTGDILVTYNGVAVGDSGALGAAIQAAANQVEPVAVQVLRDGAEQSFSVDPGPLGVSAVAASVGGASQAGAQPYAVTYPPAPTQVVVTDIKMPFESMVIFMVKWALASIPAFIILYVMFLVIGGVLGALFR